MWIATLPDEQSSDGGLFYFASLDNEHFIGVSRPPLTGEEDQIQTLLEGTHKFLPMTIARRLLQMEGAEFGEIT